MKTPSKKRITMILLMMMMMVMIMVQRESRQAMMKTISKRMTIAAKVTAVAMMKYPNSGLQQSQTKTAKLSLRRETLTPRRRGAASLTQRTRQ